MPPQFLNLSSLSSLSKINKFFEKSYGKDFFATMRDLLLNESSESAVTSKLRVRVLFGLAGILLLLHVLIWVGVALQPNGQATSILHHWDAGWYLSILKDGYSESSSAFLPLFPYLMRLVWVLTGRSLDPLLLGSFLNVVFFFFGLLILTKEHPKKWAFQAVGDAKPLAFVLPRGALAPFLLLILSPASFVFHSFHTESLFFLLSVLAFRMFTKRNLLATAVFAGLAALVRHQGVFLAVSLGLGFAFHEWSLHKDKVRRACKALVAFFCVGAVSAALWSLSFLLHYVEGRPIFSAMDAHSNHWFIAEGVQSYFKTFVLANPAQNLRFGSLLHHGFYFCLLSGTFLLFRARMWVHGTYCFLSLAIMPLQGELIDAYRFGAVLFPVYFVAAPFFLKMKIMGSSAPIYLMSILYLGLNLSVTLAYGLKRWAY